MLTDNNEIEQPLSIDEIREIVKANATRVALLGQWPEYISTDSLIERIPENSSETAPGFDAGIACSLGLIPQAKQKLAATLHANYTPEAVHQILEEVDLNDPDSSTTWWLAACRLCKEGEITASDFIRQIEEFKRLKSNPADRLEAAQQAYQEMATSFSLERYGFPFGTQDGAIQGAYVAGHKFGTMYAESYGLYFIGTYLPTLHLENFNWSDEVDEKGRPKSGPVHGSRSFVKCANETEFLRAVAYVQRSLETRDRYEEVKNVESLSPEIALGEQIVDTLNQYGYEAYFAGGFCRDLLLGKIPKDIDVATSATPEEVADMQIEGIIFKGIKGTGGEAYPVVRAVKNIPNGKKLTIEIATFRTDVYEPGSENDPSRRPTTMEHTRNLSEDAKRRDLTINALYFNPLTSEIIDPTGMGIEDIENQQIRFVGDAKARIGEDRIRILRAIRFKNRLGFEYHAETFDALRELREEVLKISGGERIRDELTSMIVHPSRAEALEDLDRLGILELILPELTAGKGVEQPPEFHSEGDVFAHQMLVVRNLPQAVSPTLAWAAVLHDIGKPNCQEYNPEKQRYTFNSHDAEGVTLARKVLERLRFPLRPATTPVMTENEELSKPTGAEHLHILQSDILWLIRQHMIVHNFMTLSRSKQIKLIMPEKADDPFLQVGARKRVTEYRSRRDSLTLEEEKHLAHLEGFLTAVAGLPPIKPRADGPNLIDELITLTRADTQSSIQSDGQTRAGEVDHFQVRIDELRSEVRDVTIKEAFGIDGLHLMDLVKINPKDKNDTRKQYLAPLNRYLNDLFNDNPNLSKDYIIAKADEWWSNNVDKKSDD